MREGKRLTDCWSWKYTNISPAIYAQPLNLPVTCRETLLLAFASIN